MADPVNQILGETLHRVTLVGAVLVSMKFLSEGVFVPALAIAIPLLIFAYLRLGDPPGKVEPR
ncbi:MAG: hypothetical protein ABEH81_02940 [Halopenitus sp.]